MQPVLGGFDPADYVSERLWATAPDGTEVPISIAYRRGFETDGSHPVLLMGYGSYGVKYDPYFSSTRLSLLDRGWAVGVAHIRGGGEMGRPWYESGKFLHKKNTFTDMIACAEHLVDEGYTTPDKLAIWGGSAGGLLMGACINLRPDLFGAVIAHVPFVDVVNTMIDADLPLTVTEWEEWGDPLHDAEYFAYIRSYAPYENLAEGAYPAMYVTAGLNDPRVGFWEPAKWVAKIRTLKTNDTPLLLRTNMGAGHSGKSGRYGRLEDVARDYAFLLDVIGQG